MKTNVLLLIVGYCLYSTSLLAQSTIGLIDSTFGVNGIVQTALPWHIYDAPSSDIIVQPDGKILQLGSRFDDAVMLRYKPDGNLDSTFHNEGVLFNKNNPKFTFVPKHFALQSNGNIIVSGYPSAHYLTSILPNGSLNLAFGVSGKVSCPSQLSDYYPSIVAVQADDKIIVADYFNSTQFPNYKGLRVTRFLPNGQLDSTFSGDGIADIDHIKFYVSDLCLQPNGGILFHGNSMQNDYYNLLEIVRLNPDGSFDYNFGQGGLVSTAFGPYSRQARSIRLQSNGKIVSMGFFKNPSDAFYQLNVLRHNSNGSIDSTFNGTGQVIKNIHTNLLLDGGLCIKANDEILIYGTGVDTDPFNYLAQLTQDGSMDSTLNGTGTIFGWALQTKYAYEYYTRGVIQADGKIVIGSNMFSLNRLQADGSYDSQFHKNGRVRTTMISSSESNRAMTILPNGKILTSGNSYAARYSSKGELDEGWGCYGATDYSNVTMSIEVLGSGKVVEGGTINNGGTNDDDFAIGQYSANGTYQSTIGYNFINAYSVDNLTIMKKTANNDLITAGVVTPNGTNTPTIGIMYFATSPYLQLKTSFSGDGMTTTAAIGINATAHVDDVTDIAIQPDGKIIIAANLHYVNDYYEIWLGRYLPSGVLDPSFGVNGILQKTNCRVAGIELQANGNIMLLGNAITPNTINTFLMRVSPNGQFDTTYHNNQPYFWASSYVEGRDIAQQPDGKILAVGQYNEVVVGRFFADGTLDTTFGVNSYGIGMNPYKIAYHPNGTLIIAGNLTTSDDYTTYATYDRDFGLLAVRADSMPICNYHVSSSPQSQTTFAPNDVTFYVQTTAPTQYVNYQWQSLQNGVWGNLQNSWNYQGCTTSALLVNNPTISNNNQQFRCIVDFAACSDTSNAATLTVNSTPITPAHADYIPFVLYPNPIDDYTFPTLAYSLANDELMTIRIIDECGNIVYVCKENNPQIKGNYHDDIPILNTLGQGHYWLQITASSKVTSIPFFKE